MDQQDTEQLPDEGPFDPVWYPAQYPDYSAEQSGVWRPIIGDSDFRVGIVWRNDVGGAGVRWIKQTDSVDKLRKHFTSHASLGTPSTVAYQLSDQVPGVELGTEQQGQLSGANSELQDILADYL